MELSTVFGILIFLAIFGGLIGSFLSVFLGNIIIFDNIFLSIILTTIAYKLFHVHLALSLLIGIGAFLLLYVLHSTKFGFWIIGGILSLFWAFVFSVIAYIIFDDMIWTYVIFGLGFIIMIALHIKAKDDMGFSFGSKKHYHHTQAYESDSTNDSFSDNTEYEEFNNQTEQPTDQEPISNFFKGVATIDELKKRYRDLLKIYHPDNQAGDTSVSQEIQKEYDSLVNHFKS